MPLKESFLTVPVALRAKVRLPTAETPVAADLPQLPSLAERFQANSPDELSPHVSGAPGSLVKYSDLNRLEQRYVSQVTPAANIEALLGVPAQEPIRATV